jgi:hypothetical protein
MPQFNSGAAEQIGRFSEGLLLRLLQKACNSARVPRRRKGQVLASVRRRFVVVSPNSWPDWRRFGAAVDVRAVSQRVFIC